MDDILQALEWYLEAKRELDECRNSRGYDAGYFCHNQYQAAEDAKAKLDEALGAYIDERVAGAVRSALAPCS